MKTHSLHGIRKKIDRIDRKLMKVVIKRYGVVERIGRLKNKAGLPVVDKKREKDILERINKLNVNDEIKSSIKNIYKCIFNSSYKVERVE